MATKRKRATKKKTGRAASKKKARGRPRVKAKRPAGRVARPDDGPREITVFDPDSVEAVLDVMPADDELQTVADLLQGMAHPSRLKALIALSEAELCVGDVAALVGLSLSATSTMLKQLRSLGYLATRSAGKQTYYKINSDAPQQVLQVVFAAAADLG
jgi:DNA-binding transcriptional ArsR family regulator